MSVSLQKGQRVDLTKDHAGLRRVMVGLGWDEATLPSRKGFFRSVFSGQTAQTNDIDCDAMAFLLDANGKIASKGDVVFYNHLQHDTGCVRHQGDNLTGAGDGDDEQIFIDLEKLPARYERIVIAVSIYQAEQRHQHFGMIRNAFIRLVNAETNQELCIYNLSENYDGMLSLIFGELYRRNGAWKFNAAGQPLHEWSVIDLTARYGLDRRHWS